MNGLPFSFVENEYNKKYTSLNPKSRPTLMKYLELVEEKVEQKITVLLPEKFGIIIDGWSDSSTSEHSLALYATCPSSSNENISTLLAFSPLIDATDFTSEKQAEFIKWNLSVFNKSVSNLIFMIGDNCSTNVKIAQDLKLPFIGCASHRLKLAVKFYIEKEEHIVRKIHELMKKLSTLKNRGALRKKTPLCPILRNVTRWSSTYCMIERYLRLAEFPDPADKEIAEFLLSPAENILVNDLFLNMENYSLLH